MDEIYKPVPDFEDCYEISNFGNVRRTKSGKGTREGKEIKPGVVRDGYLMVHFSKNGYRKSFQVHRLVLKTFVGESPLECNHKDFNRQNNRLDNLEYVTHHSNAARGKRCRNTILDEADINLIRELAKRFTHKIVANLFKVKRETISQIIQGRNWKYIEEEPFK